jgi:hypothetical protein
LFLQKVSDEQSSDASQVQGGEMQAAVSEVSSVNLSQEENLDEGLSIVGSVGNDSVTRADEVSEQVIKSDVVSSPIAKFFWSLKEAFFPSVNSKKVNETPRTDSGKPPISEPSAEVVGDSEVSEKLSTEEKLKLIELEKIYREGQVSILDLIAPSAFQVSVNTLEVGGVYAQSFYVYTYPRYIEANWLSPVVNFDATVDVSQFVYPIDSYAIMKVLRKKVAQMQSVIRMEANRGKVRDPGIETALEDAEELRTRLQRGEEKFFQFALYLTVFHEDPKKLERLAKQMESLLGSRLVLTKRADLRMERAFNSTMPYCMDELDVARNMNTSALSATFPFTSSDLTSDEGILYGLNRHNDGLIIFDRFKLENANSVVFATSGAGKSYAVKLEILRYLMFGTDVIVIDPENEYEALANTVGGTYLKISLNSDQRINPFDLPRPMENEETQAGDILRSNIINLLGLLKLMLGEMTPAEEAILDKALIETYALRGITMDLIDPSQFEMPTMMDLQNILSTMDGASELSQRLNKYTEGTYSGIFNMPSNVDINSGLMVFCIRDLEDALRPIAMYIILNYIWSKIRSKLKRRLLVIDEAWTMMQHEDSAKFLFGLVKRARKYYLGISTITQDVEDFIASPYGKPIVTNSSMQLLLKQSPAAIDNIKKLFNLTDGEKYLLLNSGVGQGLFFAGLKHVAIQIIASYSEDKLITTNPEEILAAQAQMAAYETETSALEQEEIKSAEAARKNPLSTQMSDQSKISNENSVNGNLINEVSAVASSEPETPALSNSEASSETESKEKSDSGVDYGNSLPNL